MAEKIFKFLPKAASFSVPNNNRNNKKFFSGPVVSIVPEMVKEDEPTSPEVSCIGRVNHKKDVDNDNRNKEEEKKKRKKRKAPKQSSSVIHRMLCRRVRDDIDDEACADAGKMRRFDCKEEEEVPVPHSAPILMGGGAVALEPKKEINIWMRRASPPPVPLRLNVPRL